MRFLLLIIPLCLSPAGWADKRPLDLGELKVEGELRKPSVSFYQLKSLHNTQLKQLSELSFDDFEKQLLQSKASKESDHETH